MSKSKTGERDSSKLKPKDQKASSTASLAATASKVKKTSSSGGKGKVSAGPVSAKEVVKSSEASEKKYTGKQKSSEKKAAKKRKRSNGKKKNGSPTGSRSKRGRKKGSKGKTGSNSFSSPMKTFAVPSALKSLFEVSGEYNVDSEESGSETGCRHEIPMSDESVHNILGLLDTMTAQMPRNKIWKKFFNGSFSTLAESISNSDGVNVTPFKRWAEDTLRKMDIPKHYPDTSKGRKRLANDEASLNPIYCYVSLAAAKSMPIHDAGIHKMTMKLWRQFSKAKDAHEQERTSRLAAGYAKSIAQRYKNLGSLKRISNKVATKASPYIDLAYIVPDKQETEQDWVQHIQKLQVKPDRKPGIRKMLKLIAAVGVDYVFSADDDEAMEKRQPKQKVLAPGGGYTTDCLQMTWYARRDDMDRLQNIAVFLNDLDQVNYMFSSLDQGHKDAVKQAKKERKKLDSMTFRRNSSDHKREGSSTIPLRRS